MGILDKSFVYTDSANTDVSKRFFAEQRAYARAWDEAHAENAKRDAAIAEERAAVVAVRQIKGRTK